MNCHTKGDDCDRARARMLTQLTQLDQAIQSADRQLAQAESVGMEVSAARMAQSEAKDSLMKARVAIHSFHPEVVQKDVQAGLEIAHKDLRAGQEAMAERNRRRAGLGASLLANGIMLAGLWLYIRKIER